MSRPTKVKLFGCWSCSSAAGGFIQLFCRTRSCVGSLWTWWMCNDSRNATALPSQGRAPLLSYCNEQIPTARPVLQLLSGVMQCTGGWTLDGKHWIEGTRTIFPSTAATSTLSLLLWCLKAAVCILLLFISGMFPPLVLGKTSTLSMWTEVWLCSGTSAMY